MSVSGGGSADFDKIDAELANLSFNPVTFVNSILPDEESANLIGDVLTQLNFRSKHITQSIREAVRSYSVLGDRSDDALSQTKETIQDLEKKIINIHEKAIDTEKVVQNICGKIEPLDNAKRNLTSSVTTLKRLQMITTTLETLTTSVESEDYTQSASAIQVLNTIFKYFEKYLTQPQLLPLNGKFSDLKRRLRGQIITTIETRLFKGFMDESNLPLCSAVDAFDDDLRPTVIEIFCDRFLEPYSSFSTADITLTKSRFQWFKGRVDLYNKNFSAAFPQEWRMQYNITLAFCHQTASQLKKIFADTPPVVEPYLAAFELVVAFESKMAKSFSTTVVTPFDPNAPMPEFTNDPIGIKKKYEWLKAFQEKASVTSLEPANEFVGTIASVFVPYLDLYLQSERANLRRLLAFNKEIEEETKTLASADLLIVAMRKSIEKSAGFGVSSTLLDMFMVIKELLIAYIEGLTTALPSKPKTDDQFRLASAIANTTSAFLSVTDSLAGKVTEIIDDEMKPAVNIDEVKEAINTQLKEQLTFLAGTIIKECETPLAQIGNNSWVGEGLPQKVISVFESRLGIVGDTISNDNMNRIRPVFVQKVVTTVRESLFRCRNLTVDAASRIVVTIKDLKTLVIEWTKAESQQAAKKIQTEFSTIETELTILCSPEIAMTVTYLGKVRRPSREHFISVIKIRGFPSNTEQDLIKRFDAEMSSA